MSRDLINQMCGSYPGAEWSDPWAYTPGQEPVEGEPGHDAWKVGGKIFALMGMKSGGVSLKTDSIETAALLIELGVGRKAPYMHRSWVNLPFDADPDELNARIKASYELIRKSLTKKLQATLPDY